MLRKFFCILETQQRMKNSSLSCIAETGDAIFHEKKPEAVTMATVYSSLRPLKKRKGGYLPFPENYAAFIVVKYIEFGSFATEGHKSSILSFNPSAPWGKIHQPTFVP
ncbi:hypothetical protein CEXT_795101 [Caerostris extrusa]|uniref:Uncharacterized protein n=1 Tax=Caerostris extrusa TaxID=172846 RepID=A0AAV4TVP6_CAEEX|nr:hypothetical protein CEXT_795101 [Caerostris extrusa]